jgi:hypothetical protein
LILQRGFQQGGLAHTIDEGTDDINAGQEVRGRGAGTSRWPHDQDLKSSQPGSFQLQVPASDTRHLARLPIIE